jgi:hypothetical protein
MEYTIIILCLLLLFVLYFKNPKKASQIIVKNAVKELKDQKQLIANKVYNDLPKDVKNKVRVEHIGFVIDVIAETIEDSME